MCTDRQSNGRHMAQKRLSEAQDAWMEAVHQHEIESSTIQSARLELEHARREYLALASDRNTMFWMLNRS